MLVISRHLNIVGFYFRTYRENPTLHLEMVGRKNYSSTGIDLKQNNPC